MYEYVHSVCVFLFVLDICATHGTKEYSCFSNSTLYFMHWHQMAALRTISPEIGTSAKYLRSLKFFGSVPRLIGFKPVYI